MDKPMLYVKKSDEDNDGGYLVPEVFVRGGKIKVRKDRTGIWYAFWRAIGRMMGWTGSRVWEKGNSIYKYGQRDTMERVRGLLEVDNGDD